MHELKTLIILTSPPASGKTYWISELRKTVEAASILVISPLRALADECRSRWGESIYVMTPEEWMGKKQQADIIIFDEFHLNFYWGDSFRPLMWEVFYELVEKAPLTFLLTATLSNLMQKEISLYSTHFDRIEWHNFGNQILKYVPHKYIKAPDQKWVMKRIEEDQEPVVKLIFCQYRQEVFEMEKHLVKMGFKVVSCVGGEAALMKGKLQILPRPDYIVSTTVLSHGVNLPTIRRIYFLYPVKNIDFWIQMVARGGRRGESFEVISLESPSGIKWSPVLNHLRVWRKSLRGYMGLTRLLKDLSF